MFKKIVILFIAFQATCSLYSQQMWKEVYSARKSNTLNNITFCDSLNGYVVGQNGIVLKTTDGGNSWDSLKSNTSQSLFAVCFANKNTGYACGNNGTIIKTNDAGKTWVLQNTLTTDYLQIIKVISNDTVYAFGKNGRMLKTTNGGKNWNNLTRIAYHDITSVHFYNSKTFIISAADGFDGAAIYKTKNAGIRWGILNKKKGFAYDFCMIDSITGYATEFFNKISKTTDGGRNWKEVYCIKDDSKGSTKWSSISFADKNTGYVAGSGSGRPLLLKTTDGGITWEKEEVGDKYFIDKIYITPEMKRFVLASTKEKNVILKSNNLH